LDPSPVVRFQVAEAEYGAWSDQAELSFESEQFAVVLSTERASVTLWLVVYAAPPAIVMLRFAGIAETGRSSSSNAIAIRRAFSGCAIRKRVTPIYLMLRLLQLKGRGVFMNISELKVGTGSVNIEAEVVSIEAPREINKYGRKLRVANVTIKDESGSITLVLWNEQIDKVKEGAKLKIENGYVNEWQNNPQLTLGKFGKMTVLE
jgi:replication factor A1